MISNFRLGLVARVLLLAVFMLALVGTLFKTTFVIVPLILFAAIVVVIAELIMYLEKINRDFANFLLSIKSADFSKQSADDKRGKTFARLRQAQNLIINEFQSIRIDKEAHYFFLKTVVGHIQTAIIAFDNSGEIILVNEAAKTLLHIPDLKNIFSLQAVDTKLCTYLTQLQPGHHPLLELNRNGEVLKLSVRSAHFSIQGAEHRLISIQNIKSEVESAELLAWEQLIHVLTHEIMNSMTPISSLSSTLKTRADRLSKPDGYQAEGARDLAEGLEVIERRSLGLVSFIENYKKINTIPTPEFKTVSLADVFSRLGRLKGEELQQKGIALDVILKHPQLTLKLDVALLDQVLINLLNNAAEALQQVAAPLIELSAGRSGNAIYISVKDNGAGVPEDYLGKIFIPFFSTKKTGSGIGLSLSKQVMRLHKGTIRVTSAPGKGSCFVLEFPIEN